MSDSSSFELVNPTGNSDLIILCDHASNAVPSEYGTLGLAATEFHRHIAFDIGAAEVVRGLAAHFNCPAVLGRYSRLLVDLNRGADDPTIVMKLSDGAIIPANADVDRFSDVAEFEHRIAHYHQPYHDAANQLIRAALAKGGRVPVVLSLHSFTPSWRGQERELHTGVLWDKDPRLAVPLMAALRAEGDLVVGDNEPYVGFIKNDTLYKHGTLLGLPHAILEIRQDLIDTEAGQQAWVQRLSNILSSLLEADDDRDVRYFGSRNDPL